MSLYRDDMSTIPGADVLVDPGQYRFRVSKVTETVSDGSGPTPVGNTVVAIFSKIQNDGNWLGEQVPIFVDLDDNRGRRTLKTLYEKTGYTPGPEGHDPEQLVDREFIATVVHNVSKKNGQTYVNIIAQSISSVV